MGSAMGSASHFAIGTPDSFMSEAHNPWLVDNQGSFS
jgi:hypothetical protein